LCISWLYFQLVGIFIARCVADDCLPPAFIQHYRGHAGNDNVVDALDKADTLLNMKHGMVHLDSCWGEGGATRPVQSLVNNISVLLKEYLDSGDIPEATRCMKELDAPHFLHELVYEVGC
jgi:programmed cell death protein 4